MPGNPLGFFEPPQIITDAATQVFDCSGGAYFSWLLTANRTMSAPTNMADGQIMVLEITQDATGGRTLTFPSNVTWFGAAAVVQAGASALTVLRFTWNARDLKWRGEVIGDRIVNAAKDVTQALAGPTTMSAGDITGAGFVSYRTTNAAPGTVTTRTATQLFADDPDAYVGKGWILLVNNTGAGTLTLLGGVGVTITGTLTVATNITRMYFMTYASATTVTGQLISVGSVS